MSILFHYNLDHHLIKPITLDHFVIPLKVLAKKYQNAQNLWKTETWEENLGSLWKNLKYHTIKCIFFIGVIVTMLFIIKF